MNHLHTKLRQYRIIQIFIVLFLSYILFVLTGWMISEPYSALSEWHVAPLVAAFPALIAGMFKTIESIMRRNEKDEHDIV